MIDIDRLKVYNDTFGHLAGDIVLKAVASMLADRARAADLVTRFGGEEFCICLPDTDVHGALALLDDHRERIAGITADPPLTVSAGVAEWDGGETLAGLIHRADLSLYEARTAGRDRVVLA